MLLGGLVVLGVQLEGQLAVPQLQHPQLGLLVALVGAWLVAQGLEQEGQPVVG